MGCCLAAGAREERLNDDDVVSVDNIRLLAVSSCGYCNKFSSPEKR